MTLTDHPMDRRSGIDRRRSPRDAAAPALVDPILAWNLTVPDALKKIPCQDPWAQVVQQSLIDEHDGAHENAGRAWDPRAIWELSQVQVDDGGPDGLVKTLDNDRFAVQGIYVP